MKFLLLLLLTLSARAETYPCAPPPALDKFHESLHAQPSRDDRIRQLRERLALDPTNLFLHRWYLEFATGPDAAAEYRTLLDAHPRDPAYLYLYGRALQGANPSEAIRYLQQALDQDPHFPWARRSLAQIYLSAASKDEAKAVDNLKAYIQACPYNLDAYSFLRTISDREFAAEGARRLRFLLSDRTDTAAIPFYTTLWTTEFRITPTADQEELRGRVSADLARLKQLDPTNNRALLSVLREGSRLLGDAKGQAEAAAQAKTAAPPATSAQEVQDWRKAHPRPNATDKAAQKKYAKALLKASEQWIRKYPNEFQPLHERFVALDMLDASKSELEAAGGALIRNEDGRSTISGPSVRVHVAQVWLKHDIRVSEIPAILEKGLERADSGRSGMNRMYGWGTLAEAYLKLDQPFKAREVLDRMRDCLGQNKDTRTGLYPAMQAQYYERMAMLAEKEKNKLDQLTYLERAIATGRLSAAQMEKARALWKDLGGSNEGWLVFSAPPAAGGTIAPGTPRTASRAEIGKPLPPLNLRDFEGRTWTLTSFEGKVTLVNLWATWCAPCVKELPYLQKLYDKIKDRAELQVLTLNVDDDIGLVQPFLQKNKYSFPVLLAHTYVKALLPNLSIPRNWIVDKGGALREETVGFGGSGNQWVDNALAKLRD